MNQRGFISGLSLYAIIGVLFLGLTYGLYYQVQENGRITKENETLTASIEYLKRLREAEEAAQSLAQKLKVKAENDAARIHLELANLRKEHEKLLNIVIPDGLTVGLFNAIDEANSDLSARKPNGSDKTSIPKISLGGLYEWATETVPETLKKCNADKAAIRSLCKGE